MSLPVRQDQAWKVERDGPRGPSWSAIDRIQLSLDQRSGGTRQSPSRDVGNDGRRHRPTSSSRLVAAEVFGNGQSMVRRLPAATRHLGGRNLRLNGRSREDVLRADPSCPRTVEECCEPVDASNIDSVPAGVGNRRLRSRAVDALAANLRGALARSTFGDRAWVEPELFDVDESPKHWARQKLGRDIRHIGCHGRRECLMLKARLGRARASEISSPSPQARLGPEGSDRFKTKILNRTVFHSTTGAAPFLSGSRPADLCSRCAKAPPQIRLGIPYVAGQYLVFSVLSPPRIRDSV
ncbi:hypothetical protein C8R45DRAFT_944582 [Mycena sanguinolenta]|nr:hypothetical protein C8R45DRAFT_944582 [Mycena sanguinolenta]